MITFLPYPDFHRSLQALDNKRLGNQRSEARQILQAINSPNSHLLNHPAVQMWQNHPDALKLYYDLAIKEWLGRGYKNTMPLFEQQSNVQMPDWLGEQQLHSSHRGNLLRKNPAHYGQFGWIDSTEQPYYWPTRRLSI